MSDSALDKDPNIRSILNLAACKGRLFKHPVHPHAPVYSDALLSSPEQCLFVEHAACYRSIKRLLILLVSVSSITVFVTTGAFVVLNAQGTYILQDFIFVFGLTAFVGVLMSFLVLWIAFILRTMTFWPIAIHPSKTGLIISLAEKLKWCHLDSLNPTLAVGKLQFKPIPLGSKLMLPEELKAPRFGTWLKLSYANRMRWVLLDHNETEDESIKATVDWSIKLDLPENMPLDTQQPPENLTYLLNPKIL
jgi:hypothetical protein